MALLNVRQNRGRRAVAMEHVEKPIEAAVMDRAAAPPAQHALQQMGEFMAHRMGQQMRCGCLAAEVAAFVNLARGQPPRCRSRQALFG
ncbi:MAG: hypothetical protein PVH31_03815, partial [Ectothiorhodospiraceae bacterium]